MGKVFSVAIVIILCLLSGCSGSNTTIVTEVVDGDTIRIKHNGEEESVRLLLVDTPETKHPSLPVQPFGKEASEFATKELKGEEVEMEYDGPKRDKYDRLLAYIWVDGELFNEQLLEEGLARYAYEYDPPYEYTERLKESEADAKEKGIGIWSKDGYVAEEGFRSDNSSSTNDKDCSDFATHKEAQQFFEEEGGPAKDPHNLDGNDKDGIVCESLQ
ncbi:thermonuclease family protein [Salimicrobium flavidum]|uniref:Micrococcal nuclease n=1 Tax=Salimicrobium flavidum TaxID=570947 RepID=A0A1N7KW08_9BACI|nr:thermonuclease family protein [Salimicrobium flavidum]SIS65799.1 micrococcal nuclease [Salimicrobium flavidum]